LHKPWIDEVKLRCECGKEMSRVSDVIDCWYDSGAASFAQFHYPFENKAEFEKRFPYDFIAEAIDQTRGWFYTLHVLGAALFDNITYKNVICAGHIVDENGEKMSKSKGNIIKPKEIIDKTGVDAVRLQFCTSEAGNQKRFSYNLMKESVIPFLTILYNCNSYYNQLEDKKGNLEVEDKWILSRLNSLIEKVTKGLENYSLDEPFQAISGFVTNDFSRRYIQITRDRDDTKKIVGEILEKISLLLAPFAPYISEYIYSEFSKNSVHLSSWPKANINKIDKKLEKDFEIVLKIIEAGLAKRDEIKIGLKWPLAEAEVQCDFVLSREFYEIIKKQLNVKKIKFVKGKEVSVSLDTKMTPELEAEGYAREMSRQVQAFRKELGLKKQEKIELFIFTDEELRKMLESLRKFLMERTNSVKLEIFPESVTTGKERFKKITDFRIKSKRGKIAIIKK